MAKSMLIGERKAGIGAMPGNARFSLKGVDYGGIVEGVGPSVRMPEFVGSPHGLADTSGGAIDMTEEPVRP